MVDSPWEGEITVVTWSEDLVMKRTVVVPESKRSTVEEKLIACNNGKGHRPDGTSPQNR